jgi:hypothetical protein
MNQKQLANVLIKILGLWLCAQSVSHILSAMVSLVSVIASTLRGGFGGGLYMWVSPLLAMIPAVIGLIFIVLSKPISEMLFKDE